MARTPNASDLQVDVENIGLFVFARRTLRDTFRIRGAYAELTAGNYTEEGTMADIPALAYVTIEQLLVSAPEGFTLDVDPLVDDEFDNRLLSIYVALRAKESSFRPKLTPAMQGDGKADGSLVRDSVSSSLQSSANGPEVS